MITLITAPDDSYINCYRTNVFLAGGITYCSDWQQKVIDQLLKERCLSNINVNIFNPRRKEWEWDTNSEEEESIKQIEWEAKRFNQSNIFSFYFCNSVSPQPIALFELGRYATLAKETYDHSWKDRIIVSIENGYSRALDVEIQCRLMGIKVFTNATPESHAQAIAKAINDLI